MSNGKVLLVEDNSDNFELVKFLLERAGFIFTAAVLFWLVARAFESTRPWRDAVAGVLLSVFVYVVFTRGLGLVLPGGLLEGLL